MLSIRNKLYSIIVGNGFNSLPRSDLVFDWTVGQDEKIGGYTPDVLYPQDLIKDSNDHYHYDPTTTTYSTNTVFDGYDIKGRHYTLTKTSETRFDIDYTGNSTYEGGNSLAPYCVVNFKTMATDVFKRTDTDYWNVNLISQYDVISGYEDRGFSVETLMRGVEFLKSAQPNWHIFMKKRTTDNTITQIVAYGLPEIDYNQRVKVLKAIKDKETDAYDNEFYCEIDNSATLNDVGTPAIIGDNIDKVYSINEYSYMQKSSGNFPLLESDSNGKYIQFASGDEMIFKSSVDDSPVTLTQNVYINGDLVTLTDNTKLTYTDIPDGKLYQIKSHN